MHYPDHLETLRLTTRLLTKEDAAIWVEFCSDPIATTYTRLHGTSTAEEMAEHWINLALKRYAENRLGLHGLISKETGEFIGQCGLLLQEVNGVKEVEVGYHLLRRHWGKGYATEAAQMFRDHAMEHTLARSVISLIHPDNMASKKVAIRNGMRLFENDARLTGAVHQNLPPELRSAYNVFRITKEEWRQLKSNPSTVL